MFNIAIWTKDVTGESGDRTIALLKPDNLNHEFRLLDGDGVVYAYGFSDSCDDDGAFEPLDAYTDDYGVTEIQYKDPLTNVFKTL